MTRRIRNNNESNKYYMKNQNKGNSKDNRM